MIHDVFLSVEFPVSLLHLSDYTDCHYVIANYCKESDAYREYYQNRDKGKFTILDNGAFETGKSMDSFDYLEIVKDIKPDLLVLPDTVNNAFETVNNASEFLDKFASSLDVPGFMGVLQGNNAVDYMNCLYSYLELLEYPITTIGIPYHWFYRPTLLRRTNIREICRDNNLSIHILGLPNPYELAELSLFPEVVSVDTSLPVSAAFTDILLRDSNRWPSGVRVNVNTTEIDYPISLKARQNINFLKELCKRP